jgi:N-acetylglutamate synthase-like GNAT family acetyltransferase
LTPVTLSLSNIFVALKAGAVIGVIALQVSGRCALVSPVAIEPSHSGSGIPTTLFQTLLARANELGLRELYVLAEEDTDFYAGLGFVPISCDAIPTEILSTREYRNQRSEAATLMRLRLDTRFV